MSHPKFVVALFRKLGYVPGTITRNLSCAWCGDPFTWSGYARDTYPSFCSTNHRKKSNEARRKRRAAAVRKPKEVAARSPKEKPIDLNNVGRCPTPFKITFRTKEEADLVIKRVDPTMHVYRCPCGALHIGHRNKSKR